MKSGRVPEDHGRDHGPEKAQGVGLWDSPQARRFRVTATAAFFVIGLPDAMLGVAWPSIRSELHLPVDALGVLLLGGTTGVLVAAGAAGPLLRRLRLGPLLVIATGVQAGAAALVGASPELVWLVVGCVCLGLCSGLVDSSVSAAVSMWNRSRLMNLLHASYGAGAAVAPLAVSAAVALVSWRLAYVLLALLLVLLGLGWARRPPLEAVRAATLQVPQQAQPGSRTALVLGLIAFFLAAGVEMTAAAWTASYLEGLWLVRGAAVGLGVFCYWATLAGSRAAAAASRSLPPRTLALLSVTGVIIGAAGLWAAPNLGCALAALAVLGLGVGPLLPALTSLTPQRVGIHSVPGAIGWQLGAASIGSSLCSAYAGFVLQHVGFAATGMMLTIYGLAVAVVVLALHRMHSVQLPPALDGAL